VTLGEDVLTEFDTDGVLGFRVSLTIHCWSQYKGQRETKQVQDAIYRALHHAALAVTGYRLVLSRQVDQTSERDPDGMTRHGVQTFELLVRDTTPPASSVLSPLNPNLIAMYTMGNRSGATIFDETANSRDATIVGTCPVTDGKIGDGIDVPVGTSDYISTPLHPFLGAVGAIAFWFRYAALSNDDLISTGSAVATGGWMSVRTNGAGTISLFNDTGAVSLPFGTYTTDTWHLCVAQSDGVDWECSLDGAAFTSGGDGSWFGKSLTSPRFLLGIRADSLLSEAKQNDLDQFRAYDRVLTQSEVGDLFNEPPP
jgi:hypothetical protein